MSRSTHTYAILQISQAAWDEIAQKLRKAEYDHALHEDNIIDMHGIAVQPIGKEQGEPPPTPDPATLLRRLVEIDAAMYQTPTSEIYDSIVKLRNMIHSDLIPIVRRVVELEGAIRDHHAQRADDRCWMDDQKLYAAAGLEPGDNTISDPAAMLENCKRFIACRMAKGKWPTYQQLEARIAELERGQHAKSNSHGDGETLPAGEGIPEAPGDVSVDWWDTSAGAPD